jgi:hypothetical protein
VAHLSADAVIAVADGLLCGASLARAERHLAECAECTQDVVAQRQASFALRAAALPSAPGSLLERLCGLPQTVSLDAPLPGAVSDDGQPLFTTLPAAFPAGTAGPSVPQARRNPGRRWLSR